MERATGAILGEELLFLGRSNRVSGGHQCRRGRVRRHLNLVRLLLRLLVTHAHVEDGRDDEAREQGYRDGDANGDSQTTVGSRRGVISDCVPGEISTLDKSAEAGDACVVRVVGLDVIPRRCAKICERRREFFPVARPHACQGVVFERLESGEAVTIVHLGVESSASLLALACRGAVLPGDQELLQQAGLEINAGFD